MQDTIEPKMTTTYRKLIKQRTDAEKQDELLDRITTLVGMPAWQAMKEVMQGQIDVYDNIEIGNDTPEQIGLRYMVSKVIKEELRYLMDLPEKLIAIRPKEDNAKK